ncbi:hypothetical protein FS837_004282 [Tulasnella sp. UAMH 9824]|nr:hypothetical protein FS837_004282 [Tulasnella sp. UAMH 9824]
MSSKTEDIVCEENDSSKNEAAESNMKDGKFDDSEWDKYVTAQNRIAPEIVNALRSNDRTARLDAATSSTVSSIKAKPPLFNPSSTLVFHMVEGSDEQVSAVVEQGTIPKFILIASSSPSDQARADALLALGDIGADSQDLRDKLTQQGVMKPLLEVLGNPSEHQGQHMYGAAHAIQCIAHLINPDSAVYHMVWDIIPILAKYIEYQTEETAESLEASLWALNSILSVEPTIEPVLHTNIVPRLVQLCAAKHAPTRHPTLRCVGRILASSKNGTDQLVDAGIIEAIRPCITAEDRLERYDACWVAANIAVGTFRQAKALVAAGFVTPLVHIVSNTDEESRARGNAAWALAHLTCDLGRYHHAILETLLQATCLDGLLSALKLKEQDVVQESLKGIEVFVTTRRNGKQKAIEAVKAGNGVALLRAFKLRPEPDLAYDRLLAHTILKEHLREFSLPPRV